MAIVDFILNLACLLLWLNWRASGMPDHAALPGKSLAATLRRAGSHRSSGLGSLATLLAVLVVRSFFYWQIGRALNWTAVIDVQVLAVQFSSQFLGRMMFFSFLSFFKMLLAAHAWLVLLSMLHPGEPAGPAQRMVAWQLGPVHRWPSWIKPALPLLVCGGAWAAFAAQFGGTIYLPEAADAGQFWWLTLAVGACSYLWWLPLLVGLLVLYVVESYVYLGQSVFWEFISATGRRLLQPFRRLPLRVGPVDFTPALLLVLLLTAGIYGVPWLAAWLRQGVY